MTRLICWFGGPNNNSEQYAVLFIELLDDDRIAAAEASLKEMLDVKDLNGMRSGR